MSIRKIFSNISRLFSNQANSPVNNGTNQYGSVFGNQSLNSRIHNNTYVKYGIPEIIEENYVKYGIPDMPNGEEIEKYGIPDMPNGGEIEKYGIPDMPNGGEIEKYGIPDMPNEEDILKYAIPDLPNEEDILKYGIPPEVVESPEHTENEGPRVDIPSRINNMFSRFRIPFSRFSRFFGHMFRK